MVIGQGLLKSLWCTIYRCRVKKRERGRKSRLCTYRLRARNDNREIWRKESAIFVREMYN